jgi:hypothetical protein
MEALLAPRQVIELLRSGAVHLFLDVRVPRNHGVALVKGLGRDFARMVDSHQASGVCLLLIAEIGLGNVCRGILAAGPPGGGSDRAKRIVGSGQKTIDWR